MIKVAVIVSCVVVLGVAVFLGQRYVFDADDGQVGIRSTGTQHGSRLGPGDDELEPGDSIVAGAYELTMGKDGAVTETQGGKVVWSTMTDDAERLVMQPDCNLVAYTKRGAVAWESGTAGRGSSCTVRLQKSDGNVVIVAPGNNPVWSKP